ncbi:MAG: polyprenyl synthetase family protein [Thermoflavifilum sp.]|nr:polyprenyl synthetase family protein [Thermoflavifilum sp.]
MHSFRELLETFEKRFNIYQFPQEPVELYDAARHMLQIQGKRIRPILCLMGNELFDDIVEDAYEAAVAIELFHNFTLIHDDIMDQAPLRRRQISVHEKYGVPTAILAGDVMLVQAYEHLKYISSEILPDILHAFNQAARLVCEGQQLDMEFERRHPTQIPMDAYLHMIALKTSVLLAASLQIGALIGGAGDRNIHHLYEFGKHLGIAFQIQDDWLDVFGDPEKFGKQQGGDILANKKTFLLVKAYEIADAAQRQQLDACMQLQGQQKVKRVIELFEQLHIKEWAEAEKKKYTDQALHHLEEIAVISSRKKPLEELVSYLLNRTS